MQIADLYPYWERERDQLFDGLGQIVQTLRQVKSAAEVEQVFDWIPPGGRRSISDTLRHVAYVEYYIIEKLILDRQPKTILQGSLFPKEDYPTHDAVIKLLHDVHATTIEAYAGLTPADLRKEIPAFRRMLTIERLLWSIVQEEAHHRGQVYLLLRMQGIPPPQRTD
ncbi:MAG TPA: DinB family protein [Steroidobacteraceae bacterium]|nr:DinB family protein [Steroidobacteraceae bacterium]